MITSNVHTGLTAWSNHTFAAAERCSTGGNAYQAINGGTSTSAPTGTAASVNNGGVCNFKWLSAIDYTTIQAWSNALPASLTDNVTALLWNDGLITIAAAGQWLSISGVTAGAFTILITCAPGESFRDVPNVPLAYSTTNGVAVQAPATGTTSQYVFIGPANVTFDGIQFKDPQSGTSNLIFAVGANGFVMQNCIVDTIAAAMFYSGSTVVFLNNLIISRFTAANMFNLDTTCTGSMVNNTCISTVANSLECMKQLNSTASSLLSRNNIFIGFAVPLRAQNATSAIVVDHCATDQSSAAYTSPNSSFTLLDNGNELFAQTASSIFISTTVDFRTKLGASVLDVGSTDTTHIPTATDIYRTLRPQGTLWDMGCYELPRPANRNQWTQQIQPILAQ
jgi:hypothetical protein